jgi:antitoxin component of RelBE/YafQ-DinJ toxin-antitoxin module
MLDRSCWTKKVKTVFDVMVKLHEDGNKKVTMVVGSDRIREFEVLLAKYNGVKGRHGFYHFERIDVISAGDRDPDADDASGMSASKMRAAAKDNNFTQFSQGLPKNVNNNDAKQIYNSVRKGMGLKEQIEFKNHIQLKPVSDLRESYVNGMLYNIGDAVVMKDTGEIGEIKHLGSNHVIIEGTGNQYRKWIDDIEKIRDEVNVVDFTPKKENYLGESTVHSFKDSLDEMGMPELIHRAVMAPKMKKMVRGYLNWRRKNPGQGTKGVQQVIKMMGYTPRDGVQLIDTLNKMVSKGQLPKHLAIEETDPLQQKQDREIKRLKRKHDREDDRQRLKKTMIKNRETIVK